MVWIQELPISLSGILTVLQYQNWKIFWGVTLKTFPWRPWSCNRGSYFCSHAAALLNTGTKDENKAECLSKSDYLLTWKNKNKNKFLMPNNMWTSPIQTNVCCKAVISRQWPFPANHSRAHFSYTTLTLNTIQIVGLSERKIIFKGKSPDALPHKMGHSVGIINNPYWNTTFYLD